MPKKADTNPTARLFPEPPAVYLGSDAAEEGDSKIDLTKTTIDLSETRGPVKQLLIEEMAPKPPPEITREEALEKQAEVFGQYNVDGFRPGVLGIREKQYPPMVEVLRRGQNLLLWAQPGIGKTQIVQAKTFTYTSRGLAVIYVTPKKYQAEQAARSFERFAIPGHNTMMLVTDKNWQARRRAVQNSPDVLFITKASLENDMLTEGFWNRVGLVIFDEFDQMLSKDGSLPPARYLRDHIPHVQQIVMSATPGKLKAKLDVALHDVGDATKIYVPEDDRKLVAHEESIDEVYPIKLDQDRNLRLVAAKLRQLAVEKYRSVCQECREVGLFAVPDDYPLAIPSFEQLTGAIKAAKLTRKRNVIANAYQANAYVQYFKDLMYLGRFAFLEKYSYRYAQRFLQPDLHLPEVRGPIKLTKEEREKINAGAAKKGAIKGAHKKVVEKRDLRDLVANLAQGTPYSYLFRHNNWRDLLDDAEELFSVLDGYISPTPRSHQRALEMTKYSTRLEKSDKDTPLARGFFERSLHFMAKRSVPDHQKVVGVSELINLDQDMVKDSQTVIGSYSVRHVDYLVEDLQHRFGDFGLNVESLHGRVTKSHREAAIKRLNALESHIAVMSIAWGSHGLDLSKPRKGIIYANEQADADRLRQFRGRVVGRTGDDPYHYHALATLGTSEMQWLESFEDRYAKQQSEFGHKGIYVDREFTIRRDPMVSGDV